MKTPVKQKLTTAPDASWLGATLIEPKPSRLSGIVVALLCLVPILATLLYGATNTWGTGLLAVATGIIALFWLADAFFTKHLAYSPNPLQLPLIALIVIGLIQLLPLGTVPPTAGEAVAIPVANTLTLNPTNTRFAVVQLVVLLVYFAGCLTFINTPKRMQIVTYVLIVFGFLMACFGTIQYLGGENKMYWVREVENANPFGSLVNRHHFAALMMMLMGLALGPVYARAVSSERRFLHIFAAIIMGIALIFTGSRGALLSFLGTLVFLTVVGFLGGSEEKSGADRAPNNFTRRLLIFGGGLTLVLLVLLGALLLGGDASLLRSFGLSGLSDDVSNGRFHFWATAVQIIRDYPLLGVGLNAFGVAFTRYDTWNGYYRIEHSHSDYLQFLADAGIFGLLAVLAFIVLLFWQAIRIIRENPDRFRVGVSLGALAGCFAIFIHSFFDFPLRTTSNALVFLMLVTLAVVGVSRPKLYRQSGIAKNSE